jgi:hypothetical protein
MAELGALASNLMGGSNKTAKPDLAKLDTFLDDIKTQAKKVNAADILYKDVHEAGKVLHETRGKYIDFCKSLNEFYIKPPKSEGIGAIGDAIGSAAANIPGVGKILAVVQRIATKMMDMYLASYLELRQSHERLIELSVHSLTIEAIQGSYEKHKLTYPVWFPLDKKDNDEKTFTEKADDKMKDLPDFLKDPAKDVVSPVTGAADDAKGKYDSATGDAYDFAGGNAAAEETPGSATLTAIFAQMSGGSGDTSKPAIKSASDAIIDGLNATLEDIGGIPKFLKPVIREVTNANLGLLEDVFKRIMAKGADAEIDSRALLDAGRFHLTNKIVGILTKMVMGAIGDSMPTPSVKVMEQKVGTTKSADDVGVDIPGGKHFSAKDLLAHQLNEKLGKYIEPILQYAIGDLAGQLEASRKIADKNKAQTMEVLIGRLPWLNALMFRNTFFPMWNLVAEEVFGAIAPPIKGVLKEINSVIKKAKDATDKAAEYNRRAEKVTKDAKKLGDDVSNVEVGSSKGLDDINKIKKDAEKGKTDAETETDEGKAKQAERDKAEKEKQALDDFYVKNDKDEKFPVEARKVEGTGIKVDKEIESVLPKTE